ncbi:bifunctional DNA primase/polymerase [Yersinia enterocolitica]
MMNNITHISCWYSENNIPVHPLQRGKKVPLAKGWQNSPILTLAEIKEQALVWDRKGYGLGMRTGYPLQDGSILLVVDVDIHAGLLTSEARVELHQKLLDFGLNPKEPNVITGRCPDSCHYYVASPVLLAEKFGASLTLCQSRHANNSNNPYWKIELLGKGKQVVCPPTRHPDTGNEYVLKNHNIMAIPFPLTQQIEHSSTANVKPKSLMAEVDIATAQKLACVLNVPLAYFYTQDDQLAFIVQRYLELPQVIRDDIFSLAMESYMN